MHMLLVEDDELVASGIQAGLEAEGFTVDCVTSAAQADTALQTMTTDLIILDLGLPDEDGLRLLERWRGRGNRLPVLVLTARDSVADRVAGLSAGGDDYLLKPFDLDELAARVNALLRRAAGHAGPIIEHGCLCFNPHTREVSLQGQAVDLTRRETDLLQKLLYAGSRIISIEQIKDSLYGFDADIEGNALNVHVHNLRRKLGPDIVETVRGVGYRLGPATAPDGAQS